MEHLVEFSSQHPWAVVVGLAVLMIWVALASARRAIPTTARQISHTPRDDVWQRVVVRVEVKARGSGRRSDFLESFVTSSSLVEDRGDIFRVRVELSAFVASHGWDQNHHGALFREALAEVGRAGARVVFEVAFARGVVWTWEPDLGVESGSRDDEQPSAPAPEMVSETAALWTFVAHAMGRPVATDEHRVDAA